MIYLRLLLVLLWFPIPYGIGFLISPFQWGNTNLNRYAAMAFGKVALRILGIRLEIEGLDQLEKHQPCIYVANHQGALDILTFGTIYPRHCVVIGKKEIAYIPVLNLYFVAAGNVLVDRKNRASAVSSLMKAVNAVKKRGASIWIFPEGTRNRTEAIMLPLKKGAAHMAIAAQVPIVPVVSSIIKGVNWDYRKLKNGTVRLKVLPPISTQGLTTADIDRLNETVRSAMMEAVRGLST